MVNNTLLDMLGGTDITNGSIPDELEWQETFKLLAALSLDGTAQENYKIIDAAGAFENSGNLMAEKTTVAAGLNGTINTFDPADAAIHVLIEASSVPSVSINDCLKVELSAGVFLIYCTDGTDAVRRAQIYKTLFYGTNGTNSIAAGIVGCTSIKTTVSDDVGKQAHYAKSRIIDEANSNDGAYLRYTGTFANTTTNLNCSYWSYCSAFSNATSDMRARFYRESTVLNDANPSSGTITNDEIGTNRESDESSNPATVRCDGNIDNSGASSSTDVRCVILCEGDITWVETQGGPFSTSNATWTSSNINFLTDEGIPAFGLSSATLDGTDAVFNTDRYECKGGSGSYSNSQVTMNTSTIVALSTDLAMSLKWEGDFPTNTSGEYDISDGTTTVTATVNSESKLTGAVDISSLGAADFYTIIVKLNTTNVNDTPTWNGCGVIVLRG